MTVIASQQARVLFTGREVSETETSGELDGPRALGTGPHQLLRICCQI